MHHLLWDITKLVLTTLYCGWLWISLFTGSTSLPQHSTTPQISEQRASVTTDSSVTVSDFPRTELLKVHG